MIDSISAPGTIETSAHAHRLAVSQERDSAAIAQKKEEEAPSFEGTGPKDPNVGQTLDIEA